MFVTAIHRLYGAQFFAIILQEIYRVFKDNHDSIVSSDKKTEEVSESNQSETKVKNILNCLVHFFLFQSLGSEFLFDIIKFLLDSFTESDIEILIFVLHNIGLQLRKEDPASIKQIIDLFTQKKNSYYAEKKLNNIQEDDPKSKSKE